MQHCDKKLQVEFNNSTAALIPLLQYMLGYIGQRLPAGADTEDILFRCKVIITELLTNAIKHGGEAVTLFDIEIDDHTLFIQKKDNGTPLYLINTHSYSTTNIDANKKLISADPLNSLYAAWENESSIIFSCEESSIENFLSVEQVMEHFGILIITRSSDEFTYTYDKKSHSNNFRVTISF